MEELTIADYVSWVEASIKVKEIKEELLAELSDKLNQKTITFTP